MRHAIVGVLVASAAAMPAHAASVHHSTDIDGVTRFDVVVSGTIGQHCALGSIADMDFGNLERPGLMASARVALDCNVPFTMTVTGRNGALANTLLPNGQGPYSGRVPYQIGIQMPVRHPSTEIVSKTFESHQIQGGGTISSNGGIATDDMYVNVELGAAAGEAGLLAGDYSETITITVAPT